MKEQDVYRKLQAHLNRQAVGFPATPSGVELRILKHIFSPLEAEIATCLSFRFEPLETVYARARDLVGSAAELEQQLERIQRHGGIECKIKNGQRHYCNAPLVVGMYELQLNRLTPEFVKDFNAYTADKRFGIEFLSTELPQMRTIPVAKSIRPQHNVSTFDQIKTMLQLASPPFVILECICRKKKQLEGGSCQVTQRQETCLAMGDIAQSVLESGNGREITRDEAMAIIAHNQKQGLVLQPSNAKQAEFICSCCGCCCGMLGVLQSLPRPLDFWASNFHAVVDAQACDGCGVCQKRCQVGAVSVAAKKEPAVVELARCIGCGVCVPTCPQEAIALLKKPAEVKPPQTREELYEIIMANKKNRLEKLKMTGKLVVDSVRTKKTGLVTGNK